MNENRANHKSQNRKKLRKVLYFYIALMLVLIFSSKTIYNFSLPKVVIAMPENGRLTKELEARAVVMFSETYDIYSTSSGHIDEVLIKKGDLIDENTVVLSFREQADTEQNISERAFHMERIENQLAGLVLSKAAIQEKLQALNSMQADDLHSYHWAADDAKIALERRQAELKEAQKLADNGSLSVSSSDLGRFGLVEARNNVTDAQIALKRAEIALELAKSAYNTQVEDTRKALELELKRVNLDIAGVNIDLRAAKIPFESASETNITSDYQGIVIAVDKNRGQFVSQGEKIATVAVNNHLFVTEIKCSEADGGFIEIGDEASIHRGQSKLAVRAMVYEIIPEGDMLRICMAMETNEFEGGEYISIKFEKKTDEYDTLIPNEAVFGEGANTYVWMLQSRQGALGIEYYSVRCRVLIADSDDYYTAISKGLEYYVYVPVIVSYSKDLSVNGRVVRME